MAAPPIIAAPVSYIPMEDGFAKKVTGRPPGSSNKKPKIRESLGIAAALLWKNMQTYSLTKRILPTGFNIVISGAMLCFYAYVVVSGENPPPKKLKANDAAAAPS